MKKKDTTLTELKMNNRIIDDKLKIANYMGDYFSKIGSDIQNEVSIRFSNLSLIRKTNLYCVSPGTRRNI